jgi:hypothetical protein
MKYLMFARQFPKGHLKTGQPTHFVEKIWASLADTTDLTMGSVDMDFYVYYNCVLPKGHTIRAGERFKPGDMVSLRVWKDRPYCSKQIEFAQVEVKKVWSFHIYYVWDDLYVDVGAYPGLPFCRSSEGLRVIAANDGLTIEDFVSWFTIHPKKKGNEFHGQIISWSPEIIY